MVMRALSSKNSFPNASHHADTFSWSFSKPPPTYLEKKRRWEVGEEGRRGGGEEGRRDTAMRCMMRLFMS